MQLFNPEHYQFTLHALSVLIAGAGIFCLGSFVPIRERLSRVSVKFWLFTTTFSAWLIPYGIAYASIDESLALRWFQIGEIGVVAIPLTSLFLTASIVHRERELRFAIRLCLAASLFFLGTVFFTDFFIKDLYHYPWGRYPRYGFMGMLFIGYCSLIGIFIIVHFYRAFEHSTHPRNRQRLKWVLRSFGIAFLTILDFIPSLGVSLYPFGYVPFSLYVITTIWLNSQYRLMDIRPELAAGQILETMQGAVIIIDLEGRIQAVNRVALEMTGYGKEDLIGRDLMSILLIPADLSDTVRAGRRVDSHELVWTRGNGQRFDLSLSISPIMDGRDNAPVGTVYVAQDITARKQAEERQKKYFAELQEANKKLETLDKLKSEFVSTVSHEFRTPLTSIKAFAELLLLKPSMHADMKLKLLRTINEESDRLSRLINDLLNLSRIEAGTVQWRSEDVSMRDIIQTSVDGILPLARNKELRLSTAIDESLPRFLGDRDRLIQVVTNILSNAIKFTPEAGGITIEAHQETAPRFQIVVAITDTGVGIPQEELKLIFDKFHRAGDQLTNKTEGTGLGLSITRQIVEHHGGTLWATSTYGSGSTFTFTIPLEGRTTPAENAVQ
jgi:PAS domain S-box-containing protein